MNNRNSPKHVVIVGGGFAGLGCARHLSAKNEVRVTLIDKNNYHQFQPLLYQVATSLLAPDDVAVSFRNLFRKHPNVDVKEAEVVSADPVAKTVTTSSGKSPGLQYVSHSHFYQTVANAATLSLGFVHSNPCQDWIGKQAERYYPISCSAITAVQVFVHNPKIVKGDMGELRTAGTFAPGPDLLRGGLQAFIDLDIAMFVQLHLGPIKSDAPVFGVRPTATGRSVPSMTDSPFGFWV